MKKEVTRDKDKRFRKQGGSFYIAVKNQHSCMEVNAEDPYDVIYTKDSIIIKKVKK